MDTPIENLASDRVIIIIFWVHRNDSVKQKNLIWDSITSNGWLHDLGGCVDCCLAIFTGSRGCEGCGGVSFEDSYMQHLHHHDHCFFPRKQNHSWREFQYTLGFYHRIIFRFFRFLKFLS
ncbi:hypothetical protein CDAR_501671 [Caerostris darwini]|uniref:Uncharacterized protein n=1 Tax=Caerostris darwini TaxID=1538125 RepID=A0AAV4TNM0_9ARAC|nr:hypothetical protein CDAR_501671 [Caerostris darwini]